MSHPSYGLNELREKFLRFFETKEHLRLPSFSLFLKICNVLETQTDMCRKI